MGFREGAPSLGRASADRLDDQARVRRLAPDSFPHRLAGYGVCISRCGRDRSTHARSHCEKDRPETTRLVKPRSASNQTMKLTAIAVRLEEADNMTTDHRLRTWLSLSARRLS